jgi:hypothetical protein
MIMRKFYIYITGLLVVVITSCNSTGTTTTSSDSSKTTMNPGDSAVSTTTTTTTVHHKYMGSFTPQPQAKYLDLKTRKQVTVRIDTERGTIVNSETNEPMDLFVDPVKHDTIYALTGSVVNNYITEDNGSYRVDTVRMNTVEVHTVAATPEAMPNGKYKQTDKKSKLKTDDEKIKEKNGVIKTKER